MVNVVLGGGMMKPWRHLSVRTVYTGMEISIIKIKRSKYHLIFTIKIRIQIKCYLNTEAGPRSPTLLKQSDVVHSAGWVTRPLLKTLQTHSSKLIMHLWIYGCNIPVDASVTLACTRNCVLMHWLMTKYFHFHICCILDIRFGPFLFDIKSTTCIMFWNLFNLCICNVSPYCDSDIITSALSLWRRGFITIFMY